MNCDYCGKPARLVNGTVLYPHRPDLKRLKAWICEPCDARVGCHKGTDTPLGRMANAELRAAKIAAHSAFDALWRAKMRRDKCSKHKARGAGYRWLSERMELDPKDCHIGMFDVPQCQRVVEIVQSL